MRYVVTAAGKHFCDFLGVELGQFLVFLGRIYRNMVEDGEAPEDYAVWQGDRLVATVRARPGVVGLEVTRLGLARVP
jgi:hypothetical protein